MMSALTGAITYLPATESIKNEGKAVLYNLLKSPKNFERIAASDYVSQIDGEDSTEAHACNGG